MQVQGPHQVGVGAQRQAALDASSRQVEVRNRKGKARKRGSARTRDSSEKPPPGMTTSDSTRSTGTRCSSVQALSASPQP
jgi:hypothetical protein